MSNITNKTPQELASHILHIHNETATNTHLQWLERECSKLIHKYAELYKFQSELEEREKKLKTRNVRQRKQNFTHDNKDAFSETK